MSPQGAAPLRWLDRAESQSRVEQDPRTLHQEGTTSINAARISEGDRQPGLERETGVEPATAGVQPELYPLSYPMAAREGLEPPTYAL